MAELVLDASVVVDLLVGSDSSAIADAIAHAGWNAPAHLDVEVVSALRGLVLGGHLSASRAAAALVDLDDLPIVRWPPDAPTLSRMLALRDRLSAYDAGYAVCAEGLDCALVTRDAALGRAADRLVDVLVV